MNFKTWDVARNFCSKKSDGEGRMSMDFQFDKNWHLQPINGDSGNTYMGIKGSEKVFIKRNSSPFLAVLSREGIAPKLVWTRRTSNGDVLTAQEWLEGDVLEASEVGNRLDVVRIMHHLHHSESLKMMLYRLEVAEVSAFDLLRNYAQDLPNELQSNKYLLRVFRFLEDHLPESYVSHYCACHGDATNRNWLLSKEERLYLVDWDATKLADPALDLGIILGRYVPLESWPSWLNAYGVKSTKRLLEKISWYSAMDYLLRIRTEYEKHDYQQMNAEILKLKRIFAY